MMQKLLPAAAAILVMGIASPALALSCNSSGSPDPGFSLGLEFRIGVQSEQDSADLYLNRLQRLGVDATSVEFWNGCVRAWVRNEDGPGEHMEFYDPRTLRRVQ